MRSAGQKATAYLTREEALNARARNAALKRRRPRIRAARGCSGGRHSPDPKTIKDDGEIHRAQCGRCGCDIKRMASSQRWIFCGMLAAAQD